MTFAIALARGAQVGEVLGRDVPRAAEALAHAEPLGPRGGAVADVVAVPVAPQVGLEGDVAEAVDGVGQAALERQPAHLAVGDDVDAGGLLQLDGGVDGAVLGALQLGR